MSQSFLKYIDEPLLTGFARVKRFGEEPWRQLKYPQALLIVGDKRSGKDVVLDNELLILYRKYFTCIKIFDGGGHESLYYAIKKDCKIKWDMVNQILNVFKKMKSPIIEIKRIPEFTSIDPLIIPRIIRVMNQHKMIKVGNSEIGLLRAGMMELKDEFLHCECDTSFPITVQKPPWIKIKQKEVDQFNGYYWDGFWEYNEAWQNGLVSEYLPESTDFNEIRKPKELIEKINPMIEFVENVIPIGTKAVEEFQPKWRDIVLNSRERHRVVIGLNTSFYPDTHEGKLAKYHTFGEIVYYQRTLADDYFVPLKIQDTVKQQNWHKIGLFASELWKPVPDNAISPEPEASFSKKAFLALMPTVRHTKTWIRANSQSMGDVLKKSNKQQDIRIVKRSSDMNLGEDLGWFKSKIDKDLQKVYVRRQIWKYENGALRKVPVPKPIRNMILDQEKIIEVAEMPDNIGYVINGNGDYLMEKWSLPANHHKSDSENFTADTGIEIKIDTKYFTENPIKIKQSGSESAKKSKIIREKILTEAHNLKENDGMKLPKILEELQKKYEENSDEGKYLTNMKPKSFGDIYRRMFPAQ